MSKWNDLKRLAEHATPGPWWVDSHGMTMMSMPNVEVVFNHPATGEAVRHAETGNLSHWRNDWDASYIAAANPAAILELIAENERLQANAARYQWLIADPAGKPSEGPHAVMWEGEEGYIVSGPDATTRVDWAMQETDHV